MLGGKVRDRLSCYSTSGNPANAKKLGFVGGKYPCAYGPEDGDEGLRKNVEIHKKWREEVHSPSLIVCMFLNLPICVKCFAARHHAFHRNNATGA